MPRPVSSSVLPPLHWDVFCRVIDNHGDLGVCWRLASDLARRGHAVRLWVDDAAALRWMAPHGEAGVELRPWGDPAEADIPGDVVIEAFGCDPPAAFIEAMQRRTRLVWVNLEYLSAEDYVERSHGLASPQLSGPGQGLTKWFFYPGFTSATGGLLRETDLFERQSRCDRHTLRQQLGLGPSLAPHVSVFAYAGAPIAPLLERLANWGCEVLACPGPVQHALLEAARHHPGLRVHALPWLSQRDYDLLLGSCDLNFVRGEDSFVRAQWAAKPFVWQIYAQDDGVHAVKLDAFLQRHLDQAGTALSNDIGSLWRAWNQLGPWPARLPDLRPWHAHCQQWAGRLAQQTDLVSQLEGFVAAKR